MTEELKVIEVDNGYAISLTMSTMKELNLEIGDILRIEKRDEDIVLMKKENLSFEEEWDQFFESGGNYDEVHELYWGEDKGTIVIQYDKI